MLNGVKRAGSGDIWLKVLLTGGDGAGKSTSIIFGAEYPLLMIDPENKSDAYGHLADFDSFTDDNPLAILNLTRELLQIQYSGQPLPYRTIGVDSGTVLWQRIKKYCLEYMKEKSGNPDKFKIEFNENDMPKDIFYEIINNLKRLNAHLIITAHAKDNYLKGTLMKIDPNNPIIPDVEKRLPYEVHLHMILNKQGKKYKAERARSNILDKQKNHLIPAVIDNFNNSDLLKVVLEHARKETGFIESKPQMQNVIRTDVRLAAMQEEIIQIMTGIFRMTTEQAVAQLQQMTNGQVSDPYALTEEQASWVLQFLKQQVEATQPQEG